MEPGAAAGIAAFLSHISLSLSLTYLVSLSRCVHGWGGARRRAKAMRKEQPRISLSGQIPSQLFLSAAKQQRGREAVALGKSPWIIQDGKVA
jgi:hypothetical protein